MRLPHLLLTALLMLGLLAACGDENDRSISSEDALPAPANTGEASLTGRVTDSAGAAIAEAGLAVTSGSVPAPEILVLTDENGQYAWPLPAGTFTITVFKEGYAELSQDVTIETGKPVTLDFQLQAAP